MGNNIKVRRDEINDKISYVSDEIVAIARKSAKEEGLDIPEENIRLHKERMKKLYFDNMWVEGYFLHDC